jgi:hypothetical protein
MYALNLLSVMGHAHTLYFKTDLERDRFMYDPSYFIGTWSFNIPVTTEYERFGKEENHKEEESAENSAL